MAGNAVLTDAATIGVLRDVALPIALWDIVKPAALREAVCFSYSGGGSLAGIDPQGSQDISPIGMRMGGMLKGYERCEGQM